MPRGAMACIRARTTESVPGSQPAATMLTALCSFAKGIRDCLKPAILPCMSNESTVETPCFSIRSAYKGTSRVGTQSKATSAAMPSKGS